ncbi:MAG: hypothetical protein WC707_07125 [Candidatus Babeliaceae bacterium]|jgi:hypothetical protein
MNKKEYAIYNRIGLEIIDGKCERTCRHETVRIMAQSEGYAMVRKEIGTPFVVPSLELTSITKENTK